MSMMGGPTPGQGTAGGTDIVTQLQGIVRQLTAWVTVYRSRWLTGTFTMAAAATKTIDNTAVLGTSVIQLIPTNAAAATLQGSDKCLYCTLSAGTGFTVATASGVAAAGTETFAYTIFTPT